MTAGSAGHRGQPGPSGRSRSGYSVASIYFPQHEFSVDMRWHGWYVNVESTVRPLDVKPP
jgi:hypothetical protein